jgi:hypothetical protein
VVFGCEIFRIVIESAIVGEKSIRTTLGKYWPFRASFYDVFVVVYWGFDEDSNLIDIRVQKR